MEENPISTNDTQIQSSQNVVEEQVDIQTNIEKEDKTSANESEYDSAGSYSEGEYKGKTDGSRSEHESDVEGSITLERQEGDGQESVPQKKVDDDEDKKNPQYIPKRGTFYEHDDRTADDLENAEVEDDKQDKENKKKLWHDKKERWTHDKFNDSEQAPKSKLELVQIYGYDIRNEDGPPRARRRRRYGRGPNKYTRNWEDEDAYNKPTPQRPIKKTQRPPSQSNEEFPPLESNEQRSNKRVEYPKNNKENNTQKYNKQNSRRSEEREEFVPKEQPQQSVNSTESKTPPDSGSASGTSDHKNFKIGSGRVSKPRNETADAKSVRDSDYKGFTTKSRMGRNYQNQNLRNPKKDDYIQSQNFSSRRISGNAVQQQQEELENSMANLNVQESRPQERLDQGKGQQNNQRQGSVPPRLQGEQKGSKRYSSIRQRSLPETNNLPVMHHNYYGTEISQPPQGQGTVMHQNPNLLQTSAGITQMAPPPNLALTQQVPVTATPLLQAPPQFAPGFPQPTAFIQAAVPPPSFLPPQAPPMLNYVQTPPQYPPGYQGYQAPFNPVSQPAELYQPQGGITYYSTDQQIAQRAVPQKRPKAAIPIVAPPSLDSKIMKEDEIRTEYVLENNNVE